MQLKPTNTQWRQLQQRTPTVRKPFLYAVTTTGIYCRLGCGARLPKRQNVRVFASSMAALQAGFRPCKRCKPDQAEDSLRHAKLVRDLCHLLETTATIPTLAELASYAGLSPHHLHRVFKAATGVTPFAYGRFVRGERFRNQLARGASVTRSMYQAGYGSPAPLYAEALTVLGMQPKTYQSAAKGLEIRYATASCSLGVVLVGVTGSGCCAVLLGDRASELARDLRTRFRQAHIQRDDGTLTDTLQTVVELIEDPSTSIELPLDIQGTVFQQRVWKVLSQVPPGSTISYQRIAALLGNPNAARAVGRACGQNPLAVLIPCHRALAKNGAVTGYRWSVERKKALLQREAAVSSPVDGLAVAEKPAARPARRKQRRPHDSFRTLLH